MQEVTAFSVITDYEKGIKYPLADFEITPDIAIVDPDLAETIWICRKMSKKQYEVIECQIQKKN